MKPKYLNNILNYSLLNLSQNCLPYINNLIVFEIPNTDIHINQSNINDCCTGHLLKYVVHTELLRNC